MSYNDEISEMVRNFAKLHSERDSALQELALANSEIKRLQSENERLEQLYQDEHCEVLRLQKGLKYIEKYTHSPIADTVRMGIIRNTIKELLNDNK